MRNVSCDDQGANITPFDWPFRSRRQVLLFPTNASDELTPPIHRAPPGPRAGCSPTGGVHMHAFVPGARITPGFDAVIEYFDASAVVHTRSSSRRTPDPLFAGLFRNRFPPRLLTGMTLRRFGLSACTANPEDLPPSLAEHDLRGRSSTSPPLPFQDTHSLNLLAVHPVHGAVGAGAAPESARVRPWADDARRLRRS